MSEWAKTYWRGLEPILQVLKITDQFQELIKNHSNESVGSADHLSRLFIRSLIIRASVLKDFLSHTSLAMVAYTLLTTGAINDDDWEEELVLAKAGIAFHESKIVDLDGAHQYIFRKQNSGRSVGFDHGKYRYLREGHITRLIIESQQSPVVLGVEANNRFNAHASADALIEDSVRLKLFASLPCVSRVFLIEGDRWDDKHYEDLLKFLDPDIYYVSSEYPEQMIAERKRRAVSTGARLVTIPYWSGLGSTTQIEDLLRWASKTFDPKTSIKK